MTNIKQNDLEYLKDQLQQGKMTADEANVRKVEMQRVLLVIASVPSSVRKALNTAVKTGRLCHLKKDGHKPEAYYKPEFEYLANMERNEHAKSILECLKKVCC